MSALATEVSGWKMAASQPADAGAQIRAGVQIACTIQKRFLLPPRRIFCLCLSAGDQLVLPVGQDCPGSQHIGCFVPLSVSIGPCHSTYYPFPTAVGVLSKTPTLLLSTTPYAEFPHKAEDATLAWCSICPIPIKEIPTKHAPPQKTKQKCSSCFPLSQATNRQLLNY